MEDKDEESVRQHATSDEFEAGHRPASNEPGLSSRPKGRRLAAATRETRFTATSVVRPTGFDRAIAKAAGNMQPHGRSAQATPMRPTEADGATNEADSALAMTELSPGTAEAARPRQSAEAGVSAAMHAPVVRRAQDAAQTPGLSQTPAAMHMNSDSTAVADAVTSPSAEGVPELAVDTHSDVGADVTGPAPQRFRTSDSCVASDRLWPTLPAEAEGAASAPASNANPASATSTSAGIGHAQSQAGAQIGASSHVSAGAQACPDAPVSVGTAAAQALVGALAVDAATLSPPEPLNREQGILAFNERVFAMAEMDSVPLLERLRFLSIVSANLDELFEIRVAELKELQERLPDDRAGFRAKLEAIAQRAGDLIQRQYALLNLVLTPALRAEGIVIHVSTEWTPEQRRWAEKLFDDQVEPLLTPIALDPAHPFPRISNKNLSFAVELHGRDAFGRKPGIAVVQIPRLLPRIVQMPPAVSGHAHGVVLLTSLLYGFVDKLFPGLQVKGVTQFRLTRNSDLDVDEDEITDLRLALRSELGQRHYGEGVRLEISTNASPVVVERLKKEFGLDDTDCYFVDGPVNLVRLAEMIDLIDRPDLKFSRHDPKIPAIFQKKDLFQAISRDDILVHHPYEAFMPVSEFLRSAAVDPQVVSIKQTIYRTGADSRLMLALVDAARAGKEVTVVLELMARFDEETNSNWAGQLEEVGAHVVYGIVGHKTHAKLALVIRREEGKLRRYAHLGTGNYHARTARLYEDFGLFTADEHLCSDVQEVFRRLTGLGTAGKLKYLLQAPFTLQSYLLESINREAESARAGRPARITAKVNALLEERIIHALYDASCAGVQIDLIVRGVCALRPGVPGLSENIRVVSALGRFLEHSRIYHFLAGGDDEVWLSSADWMGRNLLRRVEVAFPIRDRRLRQRVIEEGLQVFLEPGRSVWTMDAHGVYRLEGDGPGSESDPQRVLAERYA